MLEKRALDLEGAILASRQGHIGDWVHDFLVTIGKNPDMAEGLRVQKRYWLGPIEIRLDALPRCCGPEEEMEYRVDPVRFDQYVGRMVESIRRGWEPPPLIASYDNGKLSVRDGNHRHEALIRSGRTHYWALIWFNDQDSYQEGMKVLENQAQ